MTTQTVTLTQAPGAPRHDPKVVMALQRFAMSITVFNILGYTVLGFEQPWLWPFFALAAGYTTEIVLEIIGAKVEGRAPRYRGGGFKGLMEFLLPAHITSLAFQMLIYVNDRVWVMIFGVMLSVGAKWILRAPVKGKLRHFMNPSNLGIASVLLLFGWVSIAPPYHFTEWVTGPIDWLIPLGILMAGSMLNAKLTNRMPLIMAWLIGFALQAIIRHFLLGTSVQAGLAMMTGTAFILFSNYMITDPGTSPSKPWAQVAFGGGVAAVYGLLTGMSIAYAIFFATALVCLIRGGFLWALHFVDKARAEREAAERDARRAEAELVDSVELAPLDGNAPRKAVPA
ncbi:enediyne biosynthesis protein [Streptosporangiaceae bacterium NEAU-GS5]|nr:enediyne biosynthesis protein [Streptosporangiaceae bacterium NEAU-GS5]